MLRRPAAPALVLALVLSLSGCGDDDEPSGDRPRTEATDTGAATGKRTNTDRDGAEKTEAAPARPEDQPGGAGDEGGARSPAMFTGRGGRIGPRVVRVPPFLAIRVELRSADGREYGLRFGRRTVEAGGAIGSASTTLDGLRPGKSVTGTPVGGGTPVRIEASAEPGP